MDQLPDYLVAAKAGRAIERSSMPGYVIAEVTPLDQGALDRYRAIAAATIAQYGGRHVLRGGRIVETLEGENSDVERVIVLEFPSAERARDWYHSAEYAEALALRTTAMERRMFLVEGVESPAGPPGP